MKYLEAIWKLIGFLFGVICGIMIMCYLIMFTSSVHKAYNEMVTEKSIDIQIKQERLKELQLSNKLLESK